MPPKSHSRAPEPAPKVQRDAGPTSGHRHLVSRVDDDASVRRALQRLVESAGFAVETFASGRQLLDFGGLARTACLVIDVHLGDMIGFELRRTLITGGCVSRRSSSRRTMTKRPISVPSAPVPSATSRSRSTARYWRGPCDADLRRHAGDKCRRSGRCARDRLLLPAHAHRPSGAETTGNGLFCRIRTPSRLELNYWP